MKKITIVLALIFVAGITFAQQVNKPVNSQMKANLTQQQLPSEKAPVNLNNNVENKAYPDTVAGMYWDFNGALPTNWTVTDNLGLNYVWIWSTIGPIGAYTGDLTWDDPLPPIASTTNANGFLLFQSDNYNTDQTTGLIVAGYVDHDSYIQTDVLDLSAVSSVILKFQQRFRVCCTYNNADLYVSVSNDGTTWTDYEVGSTYQTINYHSSSETTVTDVTLNISNVAANQSTVYIRFHIKGLSHYYWMIDDVAITEGPQYDLVIEDYYNNFFSYDNGAYSQIPQLQSMNGPIGWRTAVFNSGGATINNVVLNTEVLFNGNSVFTANSTLEYPIASLPALSVGQAASLSRDTISLLNDDFYTTSQGLDSSFVATCIGNYDVSWIASMDEVDEIPSNNIVNTSFSVNDSVYARDNGVTSPSGSVSSQKWSGQGSDGDIFGVTYEITDTSTVTGLDLSVASSISMFIKPTTHSNDSAPTIKGVLYMSDGVGGYNLILETDLYDITPADTANGGTWLTLPFLTDGFSEILASGNYIAGIEAVAFNNGDLDIGEDLTTNQAKWATMWYMITDPTWYYYSNYSSTPMIRLNLNSWSDTPCTIGVNKIQNTLKDVEMFPNPTTGTLNIKNAEGSTIFVYSIMGDLVKTVDITTATSRIDISELSNGNYIVKVSNDLGITTQKITLVK